LLLDSLIGSAISEDHIVMLINWFNTGFVHNLNNQKLDFLELSKKHKHELVKRIWSSKTQTLDVKQQLLDELIKLDGSGDWISATKLYVKAAHPANKEELWTSYFNKDD
jgi:hypothetical protein